MPTVGFDKNISLLPRSTKRRRMQLLRITKKYGQHQSVYPDSHPALPPPKPARLGWPGHPPNGQGVTTATPIFYFLKNIYNFYFIFNCFKKYFPKKINYMTCGDI
jgi:hypothetical protein